MIANLFYTKKQEPNIIASKIYNTTIIKKPLPQPCDTVSHVVVFPQEVFDVIFTPPLIFSYIQDPSIIINKINNTNTIAADDP